MIAGGWVCLLSPLAGAVAITLAGGRISRRTAAWISVLTTFLAFGGALVAFVGLWAADPSDREQVSTAYTWLSSGNFDVELQILLDTLSSTMMLIVSGVGGLIVWYSMGYMEGDEEERRYFAYMSLFVFSMLMLVQAGNFLLMLVGWGLVGLASYLLIGFWHHKPEAVAAAKKAFVMNAVGDATFALGCVLLIWSTGSLEFGDVFGQVDSLSTTTVNLVALGLLGGAVAKSAQIPLHTWLPDAMEGPTPVSALIHAATMVTAGVYLLVRASPIFEAAPDVQHLAAIIGAITLLVAGVVALVQWDIKRVIAYSTMSQIGYMFLAAGIGAYGYAIFHLMTHAFFKALLFMTAGLVIHHLDGEQDIRKMGGLKSVMPRTHVAFAVGGLALMGIPIFSGFWSKDGIVSAAFASGDALGYTLYVAGLLGALLTGLYTARLYFAVFRGEPSELVKEHAHAGHGEGPRSMTIPVDVLTVLATVGGLVVIPGVWEPFLHWIDETAEPLVQATVAEDYGTSAIAVSLALIGFYLARRAFEKGRQLVTNPGIWRVLEHKLYFDEAYDALFYKPAAALSVALRRKVEEPVVERSLDEIGSGTLQVGGEVGRVQSGLLRTYAVAVAFAVVVLVVGFVAVRGGMLTTALIVFPIAAALVVAVLPLPRETTAGLAFLAALMEVGLWIVAATRYDFDEGGLQLDTTREWVESLGISYSVGFYGFSIWLAGAAVVVFAAAIGYAMWVGRDRSRAYHALMLFLIGAVVATFAAQDLLLFYVSFEAMLIPLYVLVGVWGGERRQAATVTFVIYTMAGSLLMLASVVAFGVTQGTFSLTESGTSDNVWIFLGFAVAFAVKAPLFPFHGWLPLTYREAPVEVAAVLSAVVSKTAIYGFLRIGIPKFPDPADDLSGLILVLASAGLIYGSVLAFRSPDLRGVVAYSSMAQMGLITLGVFAFDDLGVDGAILLSVAHGLISASTFLLVGMVERRCGTGELDELGGMARGRPTLATIVLLGGMVALAVPGSATFAGEFLIMAGVYDQGWGYSVVVALGVVLAAMYTLRLISAILHEKPGRAVRDEALDLRVGELGLVIPLLLILVGLSVWPALVSESSFSGEGVSGWTGYALREPPS